MFKCLKQLGKKALPYFAAITIGLASAYCGSESNKTPIINTNSLEDAVAGKFYKTQLKASDHDGDRLEFYKSYGPEWIKINKYTGELTASPAYSKIGPNFSRTGNFDIGIVVSDGKDSASANLVLKVLQNTSGEINTLDYLRRDENIRFVCESPCQDSTGEKVLEAELDESSEGKFNAVKILKQTVSSDTLDSMKPVEYHLLEDSECGNGIYLDYTVDGRYLICDVTQIFPGGYIKIRGNASNHTAIEDNGSVIHEYTHAIFNEKPLPIDDGYKFQESFAFGISNIITHSSGNAPDLESFCDIHYNFDQIIGGYTLAGNLCNTYGFDMQDMGKLFSILGAGTNNSLQNAKCAIDEIVGTNTYNVFNSTGITSIGNYYCGK